MNPTATTNTFNTGHAPQPNLNITVGAVWPPSTRPPGPSFPEARPTHPRRKTAAAPSGISGTADAAPGAHPPYARGPQRPAPAPVFEAGAGVTQCDYCADGLHGGHQPTCRPAELRITADHDVHPYLIQLHRGGRLLAYAIRDAYGWAVTAWVGRRVRTVARAGQLWAVEAALLIHARGGAR